MENLLKKNPDKYAVSLGVLGGGCAGFKYEWGFIDTKDKICENDHLEDWGSGKFVVDSLKNIKNPKTGMALVTVGMFRQAISGK